MTLRARCGLDLGRYKRAYVLRRLQVRARALGLKDLDEYASYFERHPREADELLRSLTIKVTQFFRNTSFYLFLERRILPDLVRRADGRPIDIWSAGCATGEEAYSIAMLVACREGARARILATDLDREAMAIARAAEYPRSRASQVPRHLAARFLEPSGHDRIHVSPEAARLVTFRLDNILNAPRKPAFDLVVCRNVLIYFEPEEQREILARFAGALRPGGCLALGRAERVSGPARERLSAVSAAERVYRRG